jgi:hypothetical protein
VFSNDQRLKAPRRFSSEGGVLSLALREPDGSSVGGEGRGDESPSSIATSASKATTARRVCPNVRGKVVKTREKKPLEGTISNFARFSCEVRNCASPKMKLVSHFVFGEIRERNWLQGICSYKTQISSSQIRSV